MEDLTPLLDRVGKVEFLEHHGSDWVCSTGSDPTLTYRSIRAKCCESSEYSHFPR